MAGCQKSSSWPENVCTLDVSEPNWLWSVGDGDGDGDGDGVGEWLTELEDTGAACCSKRMVMKCYQGEMRELGLTFDIGVRRVLGLPEQGCALVFWGCDGLWALGPSGEDSCGLDVGPTYCMIVLGNLKGQR